MDSAAIPAWRARLHLSTQHGFLKLAQEAPLTVPPRGVSRRAGIPAGVLNVVIGRGAEVGTPLVRHPKVVAISFTGSSRSGARCARRQPSAGSVSSSSSAATTRHRDGGRGHDTSRRGRLRGSVLVRWAEVARPRGGSTCRHPFTTSSGSGCLTASDTAGRRPPPIRRRGRADRERDAAERHSRTRSKRQHEGASCSPRRAPRRRRVPGRADPVRKRRRRPRCSRARRSSAVTSLYRFETIDEAIERANAVQFGLSASILHDEPASHGPVRERDGGGLLHVNSQTAGADVHVRSAASRAPATGRTSRAERRSSSTPRS